MQLQGVQIRNFRALEDITLDFSTRVSVIVGPNAAGKTTIIEAIRLVRALLSPRVPQEGIQVLQALGASSPHIPQRLRLEAIAQDATKDVSIRTTYKFSDEEIVELRKSQKQIAINLIQAQGGQAFASPDTLIAFLSSEEGVRNLANAESAVASGISQLAATKFCTLEIVFSPGSSPRSVGDALHPQFVAFLERRLPPHKTSFSYFPADRALPFGEQPVQLGGPDISLQLESYNSQPQLKFNRLKNAIFSASLMNGDAEEYSVQEEFERIFNGLLKGRRLQGFGVNDIGFLNVQIQDIDSGRVFDLDGMSSGEKGLILTFLMIARSVAKDGVVLLDEPELHLNPAVCKDILSFIIEEYARPRNLQILICTHSPEILAAAFDSDECALYHLMSGVNISRIHTQDKGNISEALRRLGSSESENLLYRGVVFVEGPDDVAILEAGFGQVLRRYKLRPSMGRAEVEKAAKLLTENTNLTAVSPSYFIIDHDGEPWNFEATSHVKVLQWRRRCLENYLIDTELITQLLMDSEVAQKPLCNEGEVRTLLLRLAKSQLRDVAIRELYSAYDFVGVGLRKEDLKPAQLEEVVNGLASRIGESKSQFDQIDLESWVEQFSSRVLQRQTELERSWETSWVVLCDGKRLLSDLSREVTLKMNLKRFKLRLMKEMALAQTANWREVESDLRTLLGLASS